MQLTDEQKQKVTKWVAEGCGLSEVQRRLASEFQINALYIDVRFLLIDLGLQIKDSKKTAAPANLDKALGAGHAAAMDDNAEMEISDGRAAKGSGVSVDVDRITRPGAVVSGTVKFSDGVAGKWMLDQAGRLALDMGKPNYRPSQADVQAFQVVLSKKLEGVGMM
jgi:hypothetical protein